MDSVRLDIWLDVACLFRTRSEAQKACKAGKVDVNGQPSKPHREIKSGDEIVISRPLGRKQRLVVYALGHLPATVTSVAVLAQVPLTALLAAALLNEPLSTSQMAGGLVVLSGIYVVTVGSSRL